MKNTELIFLAVLLLLEITDILWFRRQTSGSVIKNISPVPDKLKTQTVTHVISRMASQNFKSYVFDKNKYDQKMPSIEWEKVGLVKQDELKAEISLSGSTETSNDLSVIDAMIEEAEHYAMHGRMSMAINILNEIVISYPKCLEVWLLLLSVYRNNTNFLKFEEITRAYLKVMGKNDCWAAIKQAGRSIDPSNKLYYDSELEFLELQNSQHLLGKILVEINAISERTLNVSLNHYDRVTHGLIGNYLSTNGLISPEHLDKALQQQILHEKNSGNLFINSEQPGWIGDVLIKMGLVTELDLYHVLMGFDPKVHGTFGKHLVAIELITQKEYHVALLQQLSCDMAL